MNGGARYDVKAQAGWTRTKRDGSPTSRDADVHAANAEQWFAETYGGLVDDGVYLSGDSGYDVVIDRRGVQLRIDVVHAGFRDGRPRVGRDCCLIVNPYANKLIAADLLVLVEGPPFAVVGAIYTAQFLARATLRDHGFGPKLSLPADRLLPIGAILDR